MVRVLILQYVLMIVIGFGQATSKAIEEELPESTFQLMGSSATPMSTAQIESSFVEMSSSANPTLELISQSSTPEEVKTQPPQSIELSPSMDLPDVDSTEYLSSSPTPSSANQMAETLLTATATSSDITVETPTVAFSSVQMVSTIDFSQTSTTTKPESSAKPTEDAPVPSFADFMDNNINFTLNLYNKLSDLQGENAKNIFFSPLSIFSSLLMLHYGARGSTADEMFDALGMSSVSRNPDIVHRMYGSVMDSLSDDATSQSYVLMANKMFINMEFEVKETYQNGIKSFYNASVEKVDFGEEHTTHLINAWVSHKTNGHIRNLFKSTLSAGTSAVLLNALYFRGDWQYEFHPSATDDNASFFVDGNTKVNVSMMVNKVKLAYGESPELGASILELPYVGDRLSMFIILPNATKPLSEVQENLDIDNLKALLQSMRRRIINVRLPKFSLRDSPPIVAGLSELGMTKVFSSTADLSGLAEGGLSISDVKHEATIDVSETGSEASAATGVILERLGTSFERHFEADRPFLFFIIDKQNGMILFMGRLQNPST